MKIRTSYFYQIRFFKPNMIPISTCISDPAWYHDFTFDNKYLFKDKRGILNGKRAETIISQGRAAVEIGNCPCNKKQYEECIFLKQYQKNLKNIDFGTFYSKISYFADKYKEFEKINDEIILVFIVYEAPKNPCSERRAIINFFNENGIECKELQYPL